jgi:hypothetical protein
MGLPVRRSSLNLGHQARPDVPFCVIPVQTKDGLLLAHYVLPARSTPPVIGRIAPALRPRRPQDQAEGGRPIQ